MGRASYLLLGDWNVVCYQCGFKRKAGSLEKNWQGYYVCPEHNEPRQAQDFVRAIPDIQQVPWSQPSPTVTYTYTNQTVGFGDGVTKVFQLGSGIEQITVSGVKVNGSTVGFTSTATGLITLGTAAAKNARVTASGSEVVVS